jgi:hypothetical protein
VHPIISDRVTSDFYAVTTKLNHAIVLLGHNWENSDLPMALHFVEDIWLGHCSAVTVRGYYRYQQQISAVVPDLNFFNRCWDLLCIFCILLIFLPLAFHEYKCSITKDSIRRSSASVTVNGLSTGREHECTLQIGCSRPKVCGNSFSHQTGEY